MNYNFTVNNSAKGASVFMIFPGVGWREMILSDDGTIPIGCGDPHEVIWKTHYIDEHNLNILCLLNNKNEVTAVLRQSVHDKDVWHGSWMLGKVTRSIHVVYTKKRQVLETLKRYTKDRLVNSDDTANIDALQQLVTDTICVENGYCKGFHAAQSGSEVSSMFATLINKKISVKRFLEIGTCDGGMFIMMLHFFRSLDKYAYGCSMDLKQKEMLPFLLQEDNYVNFYQVNTVSSKAKTFLANESDFDFVFIDGDHSYQGVKNDFDLVINRSKHIAFHDIIFSPGVTKFWNEVKERYKSDFEFFEFKGSSDVYKDPSHIINGNVSTIGIGLMLRK